MALKKTEYKRKDPKAHICSVGLGMTSIKTKKSCWEKHFRYSNNLYLYIWHVADAIVMHAVDVFEYQLQAVYQLQLLLSFV